MSSCQSRFALKKNREIKVEQQKYHAAKPIATDLCRMYFHRVLDWRLSLSNRGDILFELALTTTELV
jgi:hypothetical protein